MNKNDTESLLLKVRGLKTEQKEIRQRFSLKDLKIGSFLRISGETFLIEDNYIYSYKSDSWKEFQLINLRTGELRYLEIEEDDVITACITTSKIERRNFPISMDDVEEISENEDGYVKINGETFYYEDDYKIKFKREGREKTEEAYLYEFETESGKYLTIEEWNEGDDEYSYEIFISQNLPMNTIEILNIR